MLKCCGLLVINKTDNNVSSIATSYITVQTSRYRNLKDIEGQTSTYSSVFDPVTKQTLYFTRRFINGCIK